MNYTEIFLLSKLQMFLNIFELTARYGKTVYRTDEFAFEFDQNRDTFKFITFGDQDGDYDPYDVDDQCADVLSVEYNDGLYEISTSSTATRFIPCTEEMYFMKSLQDNDILDFPFHYVELINNVMNTVVRGIVKKKYNVIIICVDDNIMHLNNCKEVFSKENSYVMITSTGNKIEVNKKHVISCDIEEVTTP